MSENDPGSLVDALLVSPSEEVWSGVLAEALASDGAPEDLADLLPDDSDVVDILQIEDIDLADGSADTEDTASTDAVGDSGSHDDDAVTFVEEGPGYESEYEPQYEPQYEYVEHSESADYPDGSDDVYDAGGGEYDA